LVNNTIGNSAADTTKGKTLFKAIEDEYTRATGVEDSLQQ
jgi:hypothetical protein